MRYYTDFKRVMAIKERSAGNEMVGDMWLEAKSFDKNTPISEIVEWARDCSGKLIITIDEDSVEKTIL